MKKIITTILLFIPFALLAQTAPPILQGSKYYEFKNALRVDSALFIPRKDTLFFDNTLKAPGMITWRPADSTFYIYRGNKWLPILSSAADTLTNRYVKNQYTSAQVANAWVRGRVRADSGFVLSRSLTGLVDKTIVSATDNLTGGGFFIGNATSSGGQFIPLLQGTIGLDTTNIGARGNRSLYILSQHYSMDTIGKSDADKNFALSYGGTNIVSRNLNDTSGRVRSYSNLFSISSNRTSTDLMCAFRIGGDANIQGRGNMAIGYPFRVGNDTTVDEFSKYITTFLPGEVLKVNGRTHGAPALNDSDYTILSQVRDSTFWTRQTAGGNISPKITGDKVGIGLATPTAKLHVISAANQFTIGTDASNNMAFTSTNGTGSYSMGVNGTDPNRTLTILSASLFSSGIGLTNIATNMYMPNVSAAYLTSLSRYLFAGATSVQGSIAMISGFTQPLSVNTSYATLNVGGNAVSTPATNVNDLITGIAVRSPVISVGGATVNKTAAAYFNNTSTVGTKNYSILSDTGLVLIGDTLIANRVRITGNLKYTKGFTAIGNVLVDTTGNGDYAPRPVAGNTPTLQQVTTAGATSSVATTFSTILTVSGGITTNPASANQANFGVSNSATLASTTEAGLLFGGVLGTTSVAKRVAFNGVSVSVPGSNLNTANAIFGDNLITTSATGVHRYIANVVIKAPQITIGAAPVLNSAALMIDSSSTAGLRNYALFIRKGDLALGMGRLKLALTPHGNPGVDSIQVKMSGDSITGLISANELTFNASAVTAGTLPILRGGTGLSSLGSPLYLLRVNAAGTALEYSSPHASLGTPTFTPVADVNDFLGTGYSLTITGDGDRMQITIVTGTGTSNNGTIGYINFTPFPSIPISVWSCGNVNACNVAGVGFNATNTNEIIFFNSNSFSPNTTYIYNISTGL